MELYLSSSDYIGFEYPRKILHFRKEKVENRNTLIIEVDIPVIGQEYGYGETDINTFYLINRFDENAFDKLDKFPIHVHVFIPKDKKTSPPDISFGYDKYCMCLSVR